MATLLRIADGDVLAVSDHPHRRRVVIVEAQLAWALDEELAAGLLAARAELHEFALHRRDAGKMVGDRLRGAGGGSRRLSVSAEGNGARHRSDGKGADQIAARYRQAGEEGIGVTHLNLLYAICMLPKGGVFKALRSACER